MKTTKSKDYLDALYEKYPDIDKGTLKAFIDYGLRSMSGLLASGNEIKIQSNDRVYMIGTPLGKEAHNKKAKVLKVRKLRRLYVRHSKIYGGVRYVSLSKTKYEEYLETGLITDCYAFKIREEAKEHIGSNIVDIECPVEDGWRIFIKKYDINDKENAEYV